MLVSSTGHTVPSLWDKPVGTMNAVDEIFGILTAKGDRNYDDGESVTQLQHALQCAAQAEHAGAGTAMITAALLHDIGHLINADARAAIKRKEDAYHENSGAAFLAQWFDEDVCAPVRHHVPAKRYLTATEADYFGRLSQGSVRSLEVQGGPFDAEAAVAFIKQPHAEDGVQLRRWDEEAKDVNAVTPPLEHFRGYVESALR